MPKIPRCCGEKMRLKESMGIYVCMECGKEKAAQKREK